MNYMKFAISKKQHWPLTLRNLMYAYDWVHILLTNFLGIFFKNFRYAFIYTIVFLTWCNSAWSLSPTNERVIETNFIALKIKTFSLETKSLVIGASYSDNVVFVATREGNTISKLALNNNQLSRTKVVNIEKNTNQHRGITVSEMISSLVNGEDKSVDVPTEEYKTIILDIHVSGSFVYVSSVFYHEDPKKCSVVSIYEYDLDLNFSRRIFDSTPCIGGVGAYTEIAGRIASSDKKIYMTGGNIFLDLYRNRYPRANLCCFENKDYPQILETTNLFGSVIEIDKKTLNNSKLSLGHRSPQGLAFDPIREVLFQTEHGPRGGDELNIITRGKHYGWPWVSLGRVYKEKHSSPDGNKLNPTPRYNTHMGYEAPIFSWTPSIGISQLVVLSENCSLCEFWANDLLVSSLKDKSINRVKIRADNRVIYSERILIGERIRDIEISSDYLFVSTDNGKIFVITPLPPSKEGPFPIPDQK